MNIGERIKELRKNYLKLNQAEFGSPLGLSQSTIGGYENNFRNVSDATVASICREYGVREEWLREGTGEVFAAGSAAPSMIQELAEEYDLDDFDKVVISEYMKLDKLTKDKLKEAILNIARSIDDDDTAIDREVEAYRQELLSEKRENSSASDTSNAKEA